MCTITPPRVPNGLRELMKDFTKAILKEKPADIYEFSEKYFQKKLVEKNQYDVTNYEATTKHYDYSNILQQQLEQTQQQQQQRVQHRIVPLSLVHAIVPTIITELMKGFIKAVLKQQPKNLCEFAVAYFQQLRATYCVQHNICYEAFENYMKRQKPLINTTYVKCSCGRLLTNGFSSETNKDDNTVLYTNNLKRITYTYGEDERAYSIQNYSKHHIKAVCIIQRYAREYFKRKALKKQEIHMTLENAVLIIQKWFRNVIHKRRHLTDPTLQLKKSDVDLNDNNSELETSYTSASTVLLSGESGVESYEYGIQKQMNANNKIENQLEHSSQDKLTPNNRENMKKSETKEEINETQCSSNELQTHINENDELENLNNSSQENKDTLTIETTELNRIIIEEDRELNVTDGSTQGNNFHQQFVNGKIVSSNDLQQNVNEQQDIEDDISNLDQESISNNTAENNRISETRSSSVNNEFQDEKIITSNCVQLPIKIENNTPLENIGEIKETTDMNEVEPELVNKAFLDNKLTAEETEANLDKNSKTETAQKEQHFGGRSEELLEMHNVNVDEESLYKKMLYSNETQDTEIAKFEKGDLLPLKMSPITANEVDIYGTNFQSPSNEVQQLCQNEQENAENILTNLPQETEIAETKATTNITEATDELISEKSLNEADFSDNGLTNVNENNKVENNFIPQKPNAVFNENENEKDSPSPNDGLANEELNSSNEMQTFKKEDHQNENLQQETLLIEEKTKTIIEELSKLPNVEDLVKKAHLAEEVTIDIDESLSQDLIAEKTSKLNVPDESFKVRKDDLHLVNEKAINDKPASSNEIQIDIHNRNKIENDSLELIQKEVSEFSETQTQIKEINPHLLNDEIDKDKKIISNEMEVSMDEVDKNENGSSNVPEEAADVVTTENVKTLETEEATIMMDPKSTDRKCEDETGDSYRKLIEINENLEDENNLLRLTQENTTLVTEGISENNEEDDVFLNEKISFSDLSKQQTDTYQRLEDSPKTLSEDNTGVKDYLEISASNETTKNNEIDQQLISGEILDEKVNVLNGKVVKDRVENVHINSQIKTEEENTIGNMEMNKNNNMKSESNLLSDERNIPSPSLEHNDVIDEESISINGMQKQNGDEVVKIKNDLQNVEQQNSAFVEKTDINTTEGAIEDTKADAENALDNSLGKKLSENSEIQTNSSDLPQENIVTNIERTLQMVEIHEADSPLVMKTEANVKITDVDSRILRNGKIHSEIQNNELGKEIDNDLTKTQSNNDLECNVTLIEREEKLTPVSDATNSDIIVDNKSPKINQEEYNTVKQTTTSHTSGESTPSSGDLKLSDKIVSNEDKEIPRQINLENKGDDTKFIRSVDEEEEFNLNYETISSNLLIQAEQDVETSSSSSLNPEEYLELNCDNFGEKVIYEPLKEDVVDTTITESGFGEITYINIDYSENEKETKEDNLNEAEYNTQNICELKPEIQLESTSSNHVLHTLATMEVDSAKIDNDNLKSKSSVTETVTISIEDINENKLLSTNNNEGTKNHVLDTSIPIITDESKLTVPTEKLLEDSMSVKNSDIDFQEQTIGQVDEELQYSTKIDITPNEKDNLKSFQDNGNNFSQDKLKLSAYNLNEKMADAITERPEVINTSDNEATSKVIKTQNTNDNELVTQGITNIKMDTPFESQIMLNESVNQSKETSELKSISPTQSLPTDNVERHHQTFSDKKEDNENRESIKPDIDGQHLNKIHQKDDERSEEKEASHVLEETENRKQDNGINAAKIDEKEIIDVDTNCANNQLKSFETYDKYMIPDDVPETMEEEKISNSNYHNTMLKYHIRNRATKKNERYKGKFKCQTRNETTSLSQSSDDDYEQQIFYNRKLNEKERKYYHRKMYKLLEITEYDISKNANSKVNITDELRNAMKHVTYNSDDETYIVDKAGLNDNQLLTILSHFDQNNNESLMATATSDDNGNYENE